MKRAASTVNESDIKPDPQMDQFYLLLHQEVPERFGKSKLQPTACPGCAKDEGRLAFVKLGLQYRECASCGSVFVSPRPKESALVDYYRDSRATKFWRDEVFKRSRSARLDSIVKPRVEWMASAIQRWRKDAKAAIDYSTGARDTAEGLATRVKTLKSYTIAHPLAAPDYAGKPPKKPLRLAPTTIDKLAKLGPADVATVFDSLDRAADPNALLMALHKAVAPGGLVFVGSPNVSGFDLQILWDRSRTMTPPDKLNVLSSAGYDHLFQRHGFEVVEFETPGRFDVDVVRRYLQAHPGVAWPRFIQPLVERGDAKAREQFQQFLRDARLSSFARFVLRRR